MKRTYFLILHLLYVLITPFALSADPIQKKILVTGGAGFLGSHLCERLLADGHSVLCLDNLYTGKKENIAHLYSNPRFAFMQHDVTQPIPLTEPFDEIYNLACPASPVHYQSSPIHTTKTSVLGALHVLELANSWNAKVLQTSTSEVYGDPLIHPQIESYWGNVNPIGIRSCYDEGKRCAETLFFDYHRVYKTKIKVARIFNTYGPRMNMNDGRVVSNFIVQALKNEPVTVYGKGEQTRSFCYVSDLVDGLIALMNSPDSITGPINLGNPQEYTMIELAQKVFAFTHSKSSLLFTPLPQDDPKKRRPDISIAQKVLGWSPKVPLNQGLKATIVYFKETLAREGS